MTKYVVDLPDNVSFIVGKGYVLFNEKEFLRIPVKQLEKYSKKEYVEVEKDEEIVYDVRKEEQMSEKYVVSQEFMNELKGWKDDIRHEWSDKKDDGKWLNSANIIDLERITEDWWLDTEISYKESNNRLIAIIRWVNGEDVFEVEKTKKWVVRSKETDSTYCYAQLLSENNNTLFMGYSFANATRFDTKEEAQSWANAHQEVIEVDE